MELLEPAFQICHEHDGNLFPSLSVTLLHSLYFEIPFGYDHQGDGVDENPG